MHTVNVHKLRVKYRLTRDDAGERRRLDQILRGVLGGALEDALTRAGVPPDAEVCIRRIHVPVRLRLTRADAALSAEWGDALAHSIRRAADGEQTAFAVVFGSRTEALLDMAAGVARGDLSRAWAWKQLGLWRANERANEREALAEFVRVFAEQSTRLVPLLRELATRGTLAALTRRLSDEQLTTLARAALSTSGARVEAAGGVGPESFQRRLHQDARRIVASSRIARAVLSRGRATVAPDAADALATLAVLEVEPAILTAGDGAARSLLNAVADLMRGGTTAPAVEADSTLGVDVKELEGDADETRLHAEPTALEETAQESAREAAGERDARQRGFTRFGGLLFLLGLVEDLGLPVEMLTHEVLARRSLRWTLQQLALALLPLEPRDAAALAFAGLRPLDDAPAMSEEAPTEDEAEAVRAFAARVVAGLRARLARTGDESSRASDTGLPQLSDAELLGRVCRRRAEIVADPGWFDVVMSLEEVSTEVRRAGLDLDPGYVAWLGVAVRFVYE